MPPTLHQQRDRELFDAIADRYCRKDLSPASSPARRHRLERTLRRVPPSTRSRLLEVGCGCGFAATYLEGRFSSYHGIDASGRLIELAGTYNASPGVTFQVANVEEFRPSRRFDLVFMIGVLHHIDRVESAMPLLGRLVEPGGWMAANEPQPANPAIGLARAIRKRVQGDYSDQQDQIGAARLRSLFEAAGLEQVRIIPQGVVSTPFAEVVIPPVSVTRHLARAACVLDRLLESGLGSAARWVSWNLIAIGRRPAAT